MNNLKIGLSEASVQRVVDLCVKIQRGSPTNRQSFDMAVGIADYVEKHSCLSDKQAVWICRNADYWKVKRPKELVDVIVDSKPSQQNAPVSKTPVSSLDDIGKEILRGLKRIEKLLESRHP